MNKILVLYYSWSNGNTKRIAKKVADEFQADLCSIDTVKPYPKDYNTTVNQGQEEVEAHVKPEIKKLEKDIKDYDTIILGTPTWWYTMAPAVLTFLSNNDFTNKTVVCFQTHGGWPGHALEDMETLCKGANCQYSYAIQFDSNGKDHLVTQESEIEAWIKQLKNGL